jgi:pimeloyl-ACP methyl ester carboxylesterase
MPSLLLSRNLTIYYRDIQSSGSPSVVLLHGLGVNNESWGMQTPALQEAGFRILTPDVRGFGKSTFPGGGISIREMACDTIELLNALNVPAAVIVGISMGGTIALQLALDAPDKVAKLVLINTFACLRPKHARTWLYFASRFILAHLISVGSQQRIVANHLFPRPEDSALREMFAQQLSQANPAGYRAAMRALARFDVTNQIHSIMIPTLVITGDQDGSVPREIQDSLAENMPHAQHAIITGAGHAVTVEKPAEVNRLLVEFIKIDSGEHIAG